MREQLAHLTQKYNFDDYSLALTAAGDSVWLLYKSYAPDEHPPAKGYMQLSNYYVASHQAYQNTQKLLKDMEVQGHLIQPYRKHNIKRIVAATGGDVGKNTLFYHPQLGSYTHIQALQLGMALPPSSLKSQGNFCGSCQLCIDACPTHAITTDGFIEDRCIRAHTGRPFIPPYFGRHIYQLFGCERCQMVCPANGRISKPAPTFDILGLLKDKYNKEIKELIGSNYGRRTRIVGQALYYAANTGYKQAVPLMEQLRDDPYCGDTATHALQILKKD